MSFLSCKRDAHTQKAVANNGGKAITKIEYARGFSIKQNGEITEIEVHNPWPNAQRTFTYAVIPKEKSTSTTYAKNAYDAVVFSPIERLVVTSTTHIPALEALEGLNKLAGFPDTQYISSVAARKLITEGKIKELGNNESLNTEITLELDPDVIVGFGINNENGPYEVLEKAGIPVVFNGDWVEQTPLGKAEWLKFFGILLNKQKEADSIFNDIKTSYQDVKNLAKKARTKPSVLSGALYKDVWYLPAGESWAAQFLADAYCNYSYADTKGTGSLSLSIESVLEKAMGTDYWVSPSQFTSYKEMEQSNPLYLKFKAFQEKKIYTFAAKKGATGGMLYYELGPQRPDLVLKDLVHILHPELLPDYRPYFFTPLD